MSIVDNITRLNRTTVDRTGSIGGSARSTVGLRTSEETRLQRETAGYVNLRKGDAYDNPQRTKGLYKAGNPRVTTPCEEKGFMKHTRSSISKYHATKSKTRSHHADVAFADIRKPGQQRVFDKKSKRVHQKMAHRNEHGATVHVKRESSTRDSRTQKTKKGLPSYMQHTRSSAVRKDTLPLSFAKSPAYSLMKRQTKNLTSTQRAMTRIEAELAGKKRGAAWVDKKERPAPMARGMGGTGVWTEKFRRRSMELAHEQETDALHYNHNVFHDTTRAFAAIPANGMMAHPAHVRHLEDIAMQGQTDLDLNDGEDYSLRVAPQVLAMPGETPNKSAARARAIVAAEPTRAAPPPRQASPLLETQDYSTVTAAHVPAPVPGTDTRKATVDDVEQMRAEIAARFGVSATNVAPADGSDAAATAELAAAAGAGSSAQVLISSRLAGARYPDSPAFQNDTDTDPGYETPTSAAQRGDSDQVSASGPGEQVVHTEFNNKAVVRLNKGSIGLGVNFHGVGSEEAGDLKILIKGIHPKMAAGVDGRLRVDDRIISVDGRSLLGKSKAEAVQLLSFTKDIVVFEIEATAERVKALEAIERGQRAAGKAAESAAGGGGAAAAKPASSSGTATNRAAAASAARQQTVLEKKVVLFRPNTQHSFGFSIASTESGIHKVATINAGGIAAKAGVKVDDVIAQVSGMATRGLNHDQFTMLCAKAAISLELVIKRTPKPFTQAPRARAPPSAESSVPEMTNAESSQIAAELQRAAAAQEARKQRPLKAAAAAAPATGLVEHTFVLTRQSPNTGFGFSIGAAMAGCMIGGTIMPEGTHFILKVNHGSPSDGNLLSEDVLAAIDGVDVQEKSHDATVQLVKQAGSSMALSILRAANQGSGPSPIQHIVDNGLSREQIQRLNAQSSDTQSHHSIKTNSEHEDGGDQDSKPRSRPGSRPSSRPNSVHGGEYAAPPTARQVTLVKAHPQSSFGFSVGLTEEEETLGVPNGSHIITKITPGSPADGVLEQYDMVYEIDGVNVTRLSHNETIDLVKNAGTSMEMVVDLQDVYDDEVDRDDVVQGGTQPTQQPTQQSTQQRLGEGVSSQQVGDRVRVAQLAGTLAYVGPLYRDRAANLQYNGGPFAGLILDKDAGDMNGSLHGHVYFENCGERRGIMVPAAKVASVLQCQRSRVVHLQKASHQASFGFDLIGPQQMAIIGQQDDQGVHVKATSEGGPAQKSGLVSGDKILAINGVSCLNKDVNGIAAIAGQATDGRLTMQVVFDGMSMHKNMFKKMSVAERQRHYRQDSQNAPAAGAPPMAAVRLQQPPQRQLSKKDQAKLAKEEAKANAKRVKEAIKQSKRDKKAGGKQ